MNRLNAGEEYKPDAPVSCTQSLVYRQHGQKLYAFFQRRHVMLQPAMTQDLPSMAMSSTPTPQPQPSTFQSYRDMMNCSQLCMPPLPGYPSMIPPEWAQSLPFTSSHMTSAQTPSSLPRASEHNKKVVGPQEHGEPTLPGTSGDMPACQLHNASSSLPQEEAETSTHSSLKHAETIEKRELRLMKNREAARECRRKKKEYVRCLENRVPVLENRHKTLIEELRALKDIHKHRAEAAARRCRVRENEYVDQMKTRIAALEAENPWLMAALQHGKKSLF